MNKLMGYYSIFYSIIIIISLAIILSLTIISNKKLSDKDQDIVNHQHKVIMKKKCMDVCDSRICGQYKERLNDFMECKKNFSNMEDMRTHLQRYHSYKKDRN